MYRRLKTKTYKLLRWSERWMKTDMIYLAKGSFWLTLGQVITSFLALLLSMAFARFISKETYGNYKYILSITSILSIFTLSGLQTSLTQAIAKGCEGSIIETIKTSIKWGVLGLIASFVLAGYYFLNKNNLLAASFLLAGIFIPIKDAGTLSLALFRGRKLFKESAINNVLQQFAFTLFFIATIYTTNSILMIIGAYFFLNTIIGAISAIWILKKYHPNDKPDPETIGYGKHLSFITAISLATDQIDKILVFHFFGPIELAIYSFSIIVPDQLKIVAKNISTLILPNFSKRSEQEIKKGLKKKFQASISLHIIIIAFYIVFAPLIYKILFPQYTGSAFYSQIFSISLINYPFSMLLGTYLTAKKKIKEQYIINTTMPIFQIITMIVLIKLFGIMGLIIARMIVRFFGSFLLVILYRKSTAQDLSIS